MMARRYAVDHVFVCTDVGAPEAELLVEFGRREGSPNRHPGQGTANRRFFFRNAMLELLYLADAAEAAGPGVRRTGLLQRWRGRAETACPFGICLRPGPARPSGPPFAAWAYRPAFFPAPAYLATSSGCMSEPLLIYLPFGRAPRPGEQPIRHPAGFERLSAVRIGAPPRSGPPSAELAAALDAGGLELLDTREFLLEPGVRRRVGGRTQRLSSGVAAEVFLVTDPRGSTAAGRARPEPWPAAPVSESRTVPGVTDPPRATPVAARGRREGPAPLTGCETVSWPGLPKA